MHIEDAYLKNILTNKLAPLINSEHYQEVSRNLFNELFQPDMELSRHDCVRATVQSVTTILRYTVGEQVLECAENNVIAKSMLTLILGHIDWEELATKYVDNAVGEC